jgi:dTDP-4-dehydrorhamnose reductase
VRVFVVGGAGQLGSAIVEQFAGGDVTAPSHAALDVTNASAVLAATAAFGPDVIVNCAAFNDVDGAEDRPDDALALNAFAVRSLARAAEENGAVLVHFSSDFVFDGHASAPYVETDAPAPQSHYAMSKLLGESFALDAPRAYVLRVESLFGVPRAFHGRLGSMDRILRGIEERREVPVFTDRIITPGYVVDIASATRHLVETGAPAGLYHCANDGPTRWIDVARELARLLGVDPHLRPVTSDAVSLKAARPLYSAMSSAKLTAVGFAMPGWRDALRRWLASRDRQPRLAEPRA